MGKGRFVNQKLAKRTGFAERQAADKQPGRRAKQASEKPARVAFGHRAIISKSSSPIKN